MNNKFRLDKTNIEMFEELLNKADNRVIIYSSNSFILSVALNEFTKSYDTKKEFSVYRNDALISLAQAQDPSLQPASSPLIVFVSGLREAAQQYAVSHNIRTLCELKSSEDVYSFDLELSSFDDLSIENSPPIEIDQDTKDKIISTNIISALNTYSVLLVEGLNSKHLDEINSSDLEVMSINNFDDIMNILFEDTDKRNVFHLSFDCNDITSKNVGMFFSFVNTAVSAKCVIVCDISWMKVFTNLVALSVNTNISIHVIYSGIDEKNENYGLDSIYQG